MANVKLPDGSSREYPDGTTIGEVAADIGKGLFKAAVAGKVDGEPVDLTYKIDSDINLEIITENTPEGLEVIRHSTSHVMAAAVTHLFPDVKLAIGPSIKDGFYYDFDMEHKLSPEDLEKIEKEMEKIIESDEPFEKTETTADQALTEMKAQKQNYKVELLEHLPEGNPIFYRNGDFSDLCRGPHVPSTGRIKAYKLLNIAGAYWRGNENNPMLQRIYGTAFAGKKELNKYLTQLEEAKKRDHRKLGKELELFSMYEESGPGLPFLLPKGATLRLLIEDFLRREHRKRGYDTVITPHILQLDLWKISGHYQMQYPMYFTQVDDKEYGLKPMNCPGHMLIYRSKKRSYRELPMRMFELGTVYRHEKSGVLHGLLRVRGFTQDDAHIFCAHDQVSSEVLGVLNFARDMMDVFGFDYVINVGTRPEKSIGTDEEWEQATDGLFAALKDANLEYGVVEKDGAFYGPKIDIAILDAIGRAWDGPTIQVDFALPERFDLTYIGSDGQEHRPAMIHRTVLGSMERFMGCLIEHYAGAFPAWLAPIQARVIAITDNQIEYASSVEQTLNDHDLRVDSDLRSETVGLKIREATLQKIPYILVIGEREVKDKTVSVRSREKGDEGAIPLDEFLSRVSDEVAGKK